MEINLENRDIINLFFKSNTELIDKIIIETNKKIENELNIINTENVLKNSKNPNELKEIFNKIEDNYNIKITNYNEELYKKGFIDGVNLILNCLEK
mgnify:FL=1